MTPPSVANPSPLTIFHREQEQAGASPQEVQDHQEGQGASQEAGQGSKAASRQREEGSGKRPWDSGCMALPGAGAGGARGKEAADAGGNREEENGEEGAGEAGETVSDTKGG